MHFLTLSPLNDLTMKNRASKKKEEKVIIKDIRRMMLMQWKVR